MNSDVLKRLATIVKGAGMDADDVRQEAWIVEERLNRLPHYSALPEDGRRAFLYRAVRNHLLNLVKRERQPEARATGDGRDGFDNVETADLIDSCPDEKARGYMGHRMYHGRTDLETAGQLRCSLGVVRRAKRRAWDWVISQTEGS